MNFENQIQQWVALDNQLKILNEKVKDLRDKRSQLTENITQTANKNNMLNSTVQISDGKLKFVNTKVQQPLTFKYVEQSLGEIIKNEQQVKQIMEHLKKNRDTKLVQEIKRYSNN
jgi:uncharacterized coiled-coil DUF342 family protein